MHKLQDEISLVPLSSYGKPYTPPAGTVDPSIDMKTAVREQVNSLSTEEYFNLLAKLLKDNPPAPADKKMVEKLAKLGIEPGKPFNTSKLGALAKDEFSKVPKKPARRRARARSAGPAGPAPGRRPGRPAARPCWTAH